MILKANCNGKKTTPHPVTFMQSNWAARLGLFCDSFNLSLKEPVLSSWSVSVSGTQGVFCSTYTETESALGLGAERLDFSIQKSSPTVLSRLALVSFPLLASLMSAVHWNFSWALLPFLLPSQNTSALLATCLFPLPVALQSLPVCAWHSSWDCAICSAYLSFCRGSFRWHPPPPQPAPRESFGATMTRVSMLQGRDEVWHAPWHRSAFRFVPPRLIGCQAYSQGRISVCTLPEPEAAPQCACPGTLAGLWGRKGTV